MAPHGVSLFNPPKFISQKEPYVMARIGNTVSMCSTAVRIYVYNALSSPKGIGRIPRTMVCGLMANRRDIVHHNWCIYELSRRFFDKSFEYVIGRPRLVQVASHGVSIFNLGKFISQEELYFIFRLIPLPALI